MWKLQLREARLFSVKDYVVMTISISLNPNTGFHSGASAAADQVTDSFVAEREWRL
jgi:hypothetical protein